MKRRRVLIILVALVLVGVSIRIGLPPLLEGLGLHPEYDDQRYLLPEGKALVISTSHDRLGDDGDEIEDYSDHWSVRLTGKLMPVYTKLHLERFFVNHKELLLNGLADSVTRNGSMYATPAFLCLMAIETSDIAFAFDSVPAVIAVTQQPLLVYAAMIFAILGLRSLYFVLAALTRYLVHLEKAVIALLFFIAAKMTLQSWNHTLGDTGFHISPGWSLSIVLGTLLIGVIASIIFPENEQKGLEKCKDNN